MLELYVGVSRPEHVGSWAQVLLNILADEIHRAHQRCLADAMCDPNQTKQASVACKCLRSVSQLEHTQRRDELLTSGLSFHHGLLRLGSTPALSCSSNSLIRGMPVRLRWAQIRISGERSRRFD